VDNYEKIKEMVESVFKILQGKGYECHSNFQCCSTCALDALKKETKKWVFWHVQDTERAKKGGILNLRWGGDGNLICRELMRAGLWVKWDGDKQVSIAVKGD